MQKSQTPVKNYEMEHLYVSTDKVIKILFSSVLGL